MKKDKMPMLILAFLIAALPPIWAVVSPYIGVKTGSVALICAGLYVANGNQRKNALKICLGFIAGDIWAVLAVFIMEKLSLSPNVELYATLFVLGALAVCIGETFAKFLFTPSWLCGWAIGLTIMGPMSVKSLGTLPIQIGIAMVVGVVYVGMGVDACQKLLLKWVRKNG